MTSAVQSEEGVLLNLSKAEALVLFEWLSRNWERTHWNDSNLFSDPAEKQLLIWLEAALAKILAEPFDANYSGIIQNSYRELIPEPEEWE